MISSWGNAAKRSDHGAVARGAGARRAGWLFASLAIACVACASTKPHAEAVGVSTSRPTQSEAPASWAYESLDARAVNAEAFRGKPTVLAFVTTDNLGSQAQVNFLVAMAKNDADKVNYALVAMHARKDREIVELYRTTLGVTFPVALAGDASISGGGPFPIEAVPTLIVLDRDGRLEWRVTGIAKPADIRPHLNGR